MKLGRKPTHSREPLMSAALVVAEREGYQRMTREAVALEARCSTGTVSKFFGTVPQLRRAVMRAAVTRGNLVVLAQGLAARDPNAIRAEHGDKRDAVEALL